MIPRYDLKDVGKAHQPYCSMVDHDDGEYVLFTDHAAAIATRDRRIARLEEALRDIANADRFSMDIGVDVFVNYLQHRAGAALSGGDGET